MNQKSEASGTSSESIKKSQGWSLFLHELGIIPLPHLPQQDQIILWGLNYVLMKYLTVFHVYYVIEKYQLWLITNPNPN